MKKLLTKKEVVAAVNKIPGLRREFKWGSWYQFAGQVQHVVVEPMPDNPLVSRYLYDPSVVRLIADCIGYKEESQCR